MGRTLIEMVAKHCGRRTVLGDWRWPRWGSGQAGSERQDLKCDLLPEFALDRKSPRQTGAKVLRGMRA